MDRCFSDFYGLHHDVGFMYVPTAVADYRLTGNEVSRKRAMHAANLLAGRFNPTGRFIRAWNDLENEDTRGWAIICLLYTSKHRSKGWKISLPDRNRASRMNTTGRASD